MDTAHYSLLYLKSVAVFDLTIPWNKIDQNMHLLTGYNVHMYAV